MKTILKILILCGIMLSMALGCEKEKSGTIDLLVELVNENNVVIDNFYKGDSVFFNFYLINKSEREILYSSPCSGIVKFLKVYKYINGVYKYLGNPEIYCLTMGNYEKILGGDTKLISRMPIDGHNWPEMNPEDYYIGDTLKIFIDNNLHRFYSRIYFTIK